MTNILTAPIGANKLTKTRPLYQYDYGQVLKLTGIELPTAYEIHFSNAEFGESKVQIGNSDGVTIPDEYLESGADIYAWLYLHTGADDGETVYKILIPVQKRASISPEEPTPVQQDAITQAIAALNDAVDRTAQDVEDAQQAAEDAQSAAASAHLSDISAQQSATEATESASEAAQSAQTATSKATQAATSASAAQTAQSAAATSAQTAQTAATAASAKADEASASATAAATKATEAAQSAQDAQGYANSAATAQSAAETAQSAAETAADEAESFAEDAQSAKEAAETLMIFPAVGGDAASVATVTDAANDQPMALKINILPAQAGSGTPAPDNIRAISGWAGANITVAGENQNIWDEEWENGTFNVTTGANITVSSQIRSKNLIPIRGGVSFYFKTGGVAAWCILYNADGTVMQTPSISGTRDTAGNSFTVKDESVTLPAGTAYMRFYMIAAYGATYKNDISINYPATDTAYHAEHAKIYEVSFPTEAGTVYGGTLEIAQDGSGTLTVNWAYLDGTGWSPYGTASGGYVSYAKGSCPYGTKPSAFLPGEAYASFTNNFVWTDGQACVQFPRSNLDQAFVRFPEGFDISNVQLVYPTSEPQTYPLTAEQVKSLLGINNVWADCGSTQITAYYADKTLLITAAEQRIENLTVSSETLPAGSPASVEKQESADGINLHFGIPKGADGQSGGVTDVQVNGSSVVTDGVANVPIGTTSSFGVVKANTNYGTQIYGSGNSRTLGVLTATDANIKSAAAVYSVTQPSKQHQAVFYGLAKAAGDSTQSASSNAVGTYTETAKSKISDMLSAPVSVTGTTPTITALSGIQYVCGEVATLDITLPALGIVDVVFESGSTPTVLTITPSTGVTVKWANGFDPTSLEANTTYELNIKDGLGVAGQWS